MELENEKELINRIKKDPEAFSIVYDHYYPVIFNYIIKRVQDMPTAQDITSETFFRAFSRIWQFQWRNIPFSAWLYKIASNEINAHLRKNKIKKTSLETLMEISAYEPSTLETPKSELEEAQSILEHNDDYKSVLEQIRKLPEKYQDVIVLKYLEKKKISEIGQILNLKEGTIKSLLFRGIKKLQYLMSEAKELNLKKEKRNLRPHNTFSKYNQLLTNIDYVSGRGPTEETG
jgi:RNA polymerase sigma-70 factor, ECF subfamily